MSGALQALALKQPQAVSWIPQTCKWSMQRRLHRRCKSGAPASRLGPKTHPACQAYALKQDDLMVSTERVSNPPPKILDRVSAESEGGGPVSKRPDLHDLYPAKQAEHRNASNISTPYPIPRVSTCPRYQGLERSGAVALHRVHRLSVPTAAPSASTLVRHLWPTASIWSICPGGLECVSVDRSGVCDVSVCDGAAGVG